MRTYMSSALTIFYKKRVSNSANINEAGGTCVDVHFFRCGRFKIVMLIGEYFFELCLKVQNRHIQVRCHCSEHFASFERERESERKRRAHMHCRHARVIATFAILILSNCVCLFRYFSWCFSFPVLHTHTNIHINQFYQQFFSLSSCTSSPSLTFADAALTGSSVYIDGDKTVFIIQYVSAKHP